MYKSCTHCGGSGFLTKKLFHGDMHEKEPVDIPCGFCGSSGVTFNKLSALEEQLRTSRETKIKQKRHMYDRSLRFSFEMFMDNLL